MKRRRLDPNRPKVADVIPLVMEYRSWRPPWGSCELNCLHCVIDDSNLSDSFLDSTIDDAVKNGHTRCAYIARQIRALSRTQRGKLVEAC